MYHREQTQNFRTNEAPLGGSFYSFLLRPRFQYLNVGDLLEYVVQKLWTLTGVRTNRVDFTLVNVCSPFTKYSHGSSDAPPRSVWPRGPLMILTFATSIMQRYDAPGYEKKIKSSNARFHDNNTTQWSPVRGQIDFVSISVDLQTAHDLGLQQPKSNELEYIYNLIGPATKSIMRNQTKYSTTGYDDVHEHLNLKAVHDRVYSLPVPVLMRQIPYHLWAFSGELWRRAPNLIPQKLITPALALYYFMYLRDDIGFNSRCSGDVGMKRLGLLPGKKAGILGHIASSVLSFSQIVKSSNVNDLNTHELLAPAVMSALLRTRSARLVRRSNTKALLADDVRTLVAIMAEDEHATERMLFPPEEVAFNLMTEDAEYIEAVGAVLGIEPE